MLLALVLWLVYAQRAASAYLTDALLHLPEVGDTIFSINGHPVTSPLNAFWAYQETIARNPLLSELRVDLNRSGVPLTKTYRIR